MTFGVNCLGHFLLVNLLQRQLVAPARVVFVTSDAHDPESSKTFMSRMIGTMPPRYRDARALTWPADVHVVPPFDNTPIRWYS